LENLLLGIISEITSYDNHLRRQRFVDARISRVKDGKFHGGLPLFGYQINKTNQGSTLIENPDESKWVRFVYESYLNGWSSTEIKQHLEENNVKTRRGNSHWSLGSLQLMLRNKSYLGDVSFFEKKSKKTYNYKIPQLISHHLFEEVQDKRMWILTVKGQYRKSTKSYLFRDFLVCNCGHRMGGRTSLKHYVQHYYCPLSERKFNKSQKENLSCSMKRCLNIPQTEEFLWNSIIEILKNTISIKEKFNEYLKEQGRLDKRQLNLYISKKTKELESLIEQKNQVEIGIIDVERKNYMGEFQSENIYKTLKKQLNKEHLSISSKIDSIQSTLTSLGSESHWYEVIDHLDDLIKEDDQLSQPKKKELIRSIIDHIKVDYDNNQKTHGLEVNFRIPMGVFNEDSKLKLTLLPNPHSTVTLNSETQCSKSPNENTENQRQYLVLTVQLTSSNLWMSPYSSHQTELFHLIKTQHENEGKNFKQISDWLNDHGYKTTRGKVFTQGHVWSMYTKKTKSNERFGREFIPNFKSISIDVMDSIPKNTLSTL